MVHARRSHEAPCGRVVWGNGGLAAHQNRCETCLTREGAYLNEWTRGGIRLNMPWATGNELVAAWKAWQREEGDRLLLERP